MEDKFFENACETLEILVSALGEGLGAWGAINLVEAYKQDAKKDEILAEPRRRLNEVDNLILRLLDDHDTGKISDKKYTKLLARYDAEMDALLSEICGFDAKIATQKKAAVNQILSAGSLALVASNIAPIIRNPDDVQYIFDYVEEKRRANGAVPV